MLVALTMPLVIAGAGLGVEVGFWRFDQVRLQQASDAAAYAAAVALREGTGTASDAGTTAATTNGYNSTTDTIAFHAPSTATPSDANSIEAVIVRTETPLFSGLFLHTATRVQSSATATYTTASDACILALSHGAAKAADFAGNSSLTLSGCSVMSDSIASNSFNSQGSSTLTAPCAYSVGGVAIGGTVTTTACPAPQPNQAPIADPYASLTIPTPSGACQSQPNGNGGNGNGNGNGNHTPTLSPGYYCGLSLSSYNLNPGTYIIDSGGLSINSNAVVSGTGVTLVFVNGGSLSMNGNSDVQLSAPTSGTYSGMLIMTDRSASASSTSITINGDNTSAMTGIIYAPKSAVSYIGNFSGAAGCTQIVANTVSWSGSTTFNDDCSAAGFGHILIGSVKLSA